MFVGLLMSINWIPSSTLDETIAYVRFPHVNVSTPPAPSSSVNPFALSVSASSGTMAVGSLMSIIWTPSSSTDATMAYMLVNGSPDDVTVVDVALQTATACAPLSSVNPFAPSVSESFAVIAAGLLMSIIWTPSSS